MRFYLKMPRELKSFYRKELDFYSRAWEDGDRTKAWKHLERAHIIGQAFPAAHTYAHWQMLKFGFRIKSTKEVIGQLPRLLVGGVKSFVGKIPVGNTGGSNVHPLKTMGIPSDIQEMFRLNT